jgi:2-isopropylmalate synthase
MTDVRKQIEIYDTTLRDGSQLEGISLTVEDKLRIAEQLDWLGVHYIEAGWPGANPKDDELFRRAPQELELNTSKLVAFGSTRRVKGKVDSDDTLRHLVDANVGTVCIVGKSWDYHVTEALGTTLDEGVAMVGDSVEFL